MRTWISGLRPQNYFRSQPVWTSNPIRGNDFTKRFASVIKAVARVTACSAVLDGEVVAIDAKGRPSFQVLQNRSSVLPGWRLAFYAFDLLHHAAKRSRRTSFEPENWQSAMHWKKDQDF